MNKNLGLNFQCFNRHVARLANTRTYYAPVKLLRPHPPGHPRGHHLFLVAPVLLSLYYFLAPPYIITKLTLFRVPRPFLSQSFFLWPRGCPGGDGGRKIWPAHYRDVIVSAIVNCAIVVPITKFICVSYLLIVLLTKESFIVESVLHRWNIFRWL